MPKKSNINFEKTFAELEDLVNKIEEGDLSLEESLKCFERGMLLTKNCQQALSEAEQKVKIFHRFWCFAAIFVDRYNLGDR